MHIMTSTLKRVLGKKRNLINRRIRRFLMIPTEVGIREVKSTRRIAMSHVLAEEILKTM